MNLKRRLERLKQAQDRARRGEQQGESPEKDCQSVSNERSSLEDKHALESLREQLREAFGAGRDESTDSSGLGQAAVAVQPRRELSDLPFEEVQNSAGSVLQRLEILPASHCIGNRRLGAAHTAVAERLAQLALDPEWCGVDPQGLLFFDTETTGLAGAGTLAFLVGLASLNPDGSVTVEQLLLEDPAGEAALLFRVEECFARASGLVSFNGKAFDRPLLAARGVMNHRPELPRRPHLDLLHIGRRLHRARLGKCNLGQVEKRVLQFDRGPDIAGSDIAPIYGQFLRTGDATEVEQVVQHNYWDVLSMVALVGLYGELDTSLHPEDLAGLARTLRRAGATDAATEVAERACRCGGGRAALRIRVDLAKSRKDYQLATDDLEHLSATGDEPGPHLELAKLYEHVWRSPRQALDWVERGTAEPVEADERRRARLARKIARQPPAE